MKRTIVWLLPILISGLILTGCSPKSRYDRMLKRELASGVRYDSLFIGLYFGMPEKTFYLHCWDLNKQGKIRQGESNTTVLYDLKKELKHPAVMDFYPRFKEGRIYELPIRFKYTGWAPWNKELSADNLQLDVLEWYKKIYGDGFIKVQHPKRGVAYVKVNGNRRITIFKESDLHVWAYFTDLSVTKETSFNPGK
jgi:hypothetical protein